MDNIFYSIRTLVAFGIALTVGLVVFPILIFVELIYLVAIEFTLGTINWPTVNLHGVETSVTSLTPKVLDFQ